MVFPVCISDGQIQWHSLKIISKKIQHRVPAKKRSNKNKEKMVNSSLNTYAMQVKQNLPPYCFGLLVGTRNEQQE